MRIIIDKIAKLFLSRMKNRTEAYVEAQEIINDLLTAANISQDKEYAMGIIFDCRNRFENKCQKYKEEPMEKLKRLIGIIAGWINDPNCFVGSKMDGKAGSIWIFEEISRVREMVEKAKKYWAIPYCIQRRLHFPSWKSLLTGD